MHGRLKVRTTEEQLRLKKKEQARKLEAYQKGLAKIFSARHELPYNENCFAISFQILQSNPDIYTLWNYRKEVLLAELDRLSVDENVDAIVSLFDNELRLTEYSLVTNPKSYSSWHHRYWILESHPRPNWHHEMSLCDKYFSADDRNFHCWDYRRQILNKVGSSTDDELKFSTNRININFSNYSSWHYRSTLIQLNETNVPIEIDLVKNAIFTDPNDSSAWFYLRWILKSKVTTDECRIKLFNDLKLLREMEPKCKWIYMGIAWLTEDLAESDVNFQSICLDNFKKLIEFDPTRRGRYLDHMKRLQNIS